jgi:hypothetical protein
MTAQPRPTVVSARIREKRGDTLIGTLRQIYGEDFAPGKRSDMRLDTLREETGKSLSELVHRDRK